MALLTYVGAGYDHKEGDYRATCRQALLWMRKHQLADGSFDNANDLRDTALAAQALCDCYGLSGDMIVKKLADKAVAHLLSRRTPGSGWGLQSTSRPDAISTGYAILVVKTALVAGLEFDYQETLRDAAKFMEGLVPEDPDADIRYSADYESPPGVSGRAPVASACWVFVMLFSGKYEPNNKTLKRRADRLIDADCLPAWEAGRVDFEYWWMASLALYQVGGSRWKAWQKPLSTSLLRNQRGYREVEKGLTKADIDEHGSWDSVDKWNSGCGRVECTALAALSMEIYYRYLRLEGTSESD